MIFRLRLIVLLSSMVKVIECAGHSNLRNIYDVNALSDKIEDLIEDSLKANQFQKYLDSLEFESTDIPSEERGLKTLNSAFENITIALRRLQVAIEYDFFHQSIDSSIFKIAHCCRVKNYHFDMEFPTNISRMESCYVTSSNVYSMKETASTMNQSLKEVPLLKWQYLFLYNQYGLIYPANRNYCEAIGRDDYRLGGWFSRTVSPTPKEFVFAIDVSRTMDTLFQGITKLKTALYIVENILDGLTYRDKFNIIAFSKSLTVLRNSEPNDRCFSIPLARATQGNKITAKEFLLGLKAQGGGTKYRRVLRKCFDYLNNSYDHETVHINMRRIILISGQGEEDRFKNLSKFIQEQNALQNNSIGIYTFGIGKEELKDLQSLSAETGEKGGFGAVKRLSHVNDQLSAFFYSLRPLSGSAVTNHPIQIIWTVNYEDSLGLGRVVTASLPVYRENVLFGVAGVDFLFQDLFTDSYLFRPDSFSYAFLVNQEGFLIHHPILPFGEQTESVHASIAETDDDFTEVLEDMIRGIGGTKTFLAKRLLPADSSNNVQTKRVKIESNYTWEKLENTSFSLCVVQATNSSLAVLKSNIFLSSDGFLFHRMDLVMPKTPCSHRQYLSTTETTTVFIEPKGFLGPVRFKTHALRQSDVEGIAKWIEGSGPNKLKIKSRVKDDVLITGKFNQLWNVENNYKYQVGKYVAWRFVITGNGVTRMFPGISLNSWQAFSDGILYKKALVETDNYVFLFPYMEPTLKLPVITALKTLHVTRSDHGTKEAFGVAGVDLLLSFFDAEIRRFFDTQSTANKPYILDDGGYVMLSNDYLRDEHEIQLRHLSTIEPTLFSTLLKSGIARRKNCSNFETLLLNKEYSIFLNAGNPYEGQFSDNKMQSCHSFLLHRIPKTSLLLLIRSMEKTKCNQNVTSSEDCKCDSENQKLHVFRNDARPTCTENRTNLHCECPCSAMNEYFSVCNDGYPSKATSYIPNPCLTGSAGGAKLFDDDVRDATSCEGTGCFPACLFISQKDQAHDQVPKSSLKSLIFKVFVILLAVGCVIICGFLRRYQTLYQLRKSAALKLISQVQRMTASTQDVDEQARVSLLNPNVTQPMKLNKDARGSFTTNPSIINEEARSSFATTPSSNNEEARSSFAAQKSTQEVNLPNKLSDNSLSAKHQKPTNFEIACKEDQVVSKNYQFLENSQDYENSQDNQD